MAGEKYDVTGTVKAKNGKGNAINIEDTWYSVFSASDLNDVDKGDKVAFQAADNEANGKTFHNIKSKVKIEEKGQGSAQGGGNGKGGGGGNGYRKNGEAGGFPIHERAYERALDRRSAVGQAIEVYRGTVTNESKSKLPSPDQYGSPEEWAEEIVGPVLALAKRIEAYTTGDLDKEALKNITGEESE